MVWQHLESYSQFEGLWFKEKCWETGEDAVDNNQDCLGPRAHNLEAEIEGARLV